MITWAKVDPITGRIMATGASREPQAPVDHEGLLCIEYQGHIEDYAFDPETQTLTKSDLYEQRLVAIEAKRPDIAVQARAGRQAKLDVK